MDNKKFSKEAFDNIKKALDKIKFEGTTLNGEFIPYKPMPKGESIDNLIEKGRYIPIPVDLNDVSDAARYALNTSDSNAPSNGWVAIPALDTVKPLTPHEIGIDWQKDLKDKFVLKYNNKYVYSKGVYFSYPEEAKTFGTVMEALNYADSLELENIIVDKL